MTGPAYRVETDRLLLRCWAPTDGPALRASLDTSDAYLRPWIPWMRHEPRSLAETVAWLRGVRSSFDGDRDFRYGIFDPGDRMVLGETGLYTRVGPNAREIGYWLRPDIAGRGYATEATAAMIRVGFEIDNVDRLEIHCDPENQPSAAVPAKLGFAHEATLRRRATDSEGRVRDSMVWTLFAADYARSPAAAVPVRAYDCLGERIL